MVIAFKKFESKTAWSKVIASALTASLLFAGLGLFATISASSTANAASPAQNTPTWAGPATI